jgi:hypothetical protein
MTDPLFDPHLRRGLVQALAGLALLRVVPDAPAAEPPKPTAPSVPKGIARAGEFDFLVGEWKIKHRRRKAAGRDEWDEFDGEATCWNILAGVVNIEELRIPARNFSGMGIRILDADQQVWRELWVNAKSGVLEGPGMPGGMVGSEARFEADDSDGESKPIKIRSLWDQIGPGRCRWQQLLSRDGGASWQADWIMDWRRT